MPAAHRVPALTGVSADPRPPGECPAAELDADLRRPPQVLDPVRAVAAAGEEVDPIRVYREPHLDPARPPRHAPARGQIAERLLGQAGHDIDATRKPAWGGGSKESTPSWSSPMAQRGVSPMSGGPSAGRSVSGTGVILRGATPPLVFFG